MPRPLATDTRRLVALTAGLMAALALAMPSIWTLFQYTGSTFAVCISLIFPAGAIVPQVRHQQLLRAFGTSAMKIQK
jgi:hypothetical protein